MAKTKKMDADERVETPPPPAFSKAQFLASEKSAVKRAVLAAVLNDGKTYTKDAAAKLVAAYMERKV